MTASKSLPRIRSGDPHSGKTRRDRSRRLGRSRLSAPSEHKTCRNAIAPGDLGYLRPRHQRFFHNPRLLVGRPLPPTLDTAKKGGQATAGRRGLAWPAKSSGRNSPWVVAWPARKFKGWAAKQGPKSRAGHRRAAGGRHHEQEGHRGPIIFVHGSTHTHRSRRLGHMKTST
jgi:hypothetical protein